jgi:hypothetical protein
VIPRFDLSDLDSIEDLPRRLNGRLRKKGEENMKSCLVILSCCILMALAGSAVWAQEQPTLGQTEEANFKAYVELLRKDLNKDKVSILTEMMDLSPEEAAKFWPLYNSYDQELTKLRDQRVAFIRMYAENIGSLTDEKVTQIVNGLLDMESNRIQLRKKYFQTVSKALSAKLAARFVQVESQIEKLVDLQIAASLPVVE